MRVAGALALVFVVSGCTSVKVVQRDGCWVRRTERLGQVKEDLGPCAKPQPAWVADRHTRLVQECVAQADYRYQTMAMAAWQKGQPLPAEQSQEQILQMCMAEASKAYVNENDDLKAKLAEVSNERANLQQALAEDQLHLRQSQEKLTDYLGEAAQKPAGTATASATATGSGDSKTDSQTAASQPAVAPAMTYIVGPNGAQATPQQAMSPVEIDARAKKAKASSANTNGGYGGSGPICTPPAKDAVEKALEQGQPTADASIAETAKPASATPAAAPAK